MQNNNGADARPNLFPSDDLMALLELDPNETYVPLDRLCARLGLPATPQERAVRTHAILSEGAKRFAIEDQLGERRALCLRVDLLPLWLAGLNANNVSEPVARARLELLQREAASVLWQTFRPQGYGPEDALLPNRHAQNQVERAYVEALGVALLARQQLLIERQLHGTYHDEDDQQGHDPWARVGTRVDDPQAARLAQTVRRVAQTAAQRSRRNEYHGIYTGLFRQFGITSFRRMPPARLHEALEWLERWHGALLGEPEPPPDI